jgi:2-polyprenyl-6-hydroxyphenyl methylase/3-demethylubiquinone-9 3-methyltransferase
MTIASLAAQQKNYDPTQMKRRISVRWRRTGGIAKGSSAMLHRLNPVRLGFIRDAVDMHFGSADAVRSRCRARRALDVGCGAGLLCEPLARLGASVTGVDAAVENIAAAKAHAEQSGLSIDYRAGELAAPKSVDQFDVVTSMEVIEHVTDAAAFVG